MSGDVVLGTFERVLALKKLPAFAELDPADLAPLAACMVPRAVPAGAALPAADDAGSVHVLLEGCVRDGGDRRDAPELLGVLDVLAGDRPPERAAAVESSLLEIRRPAFLTILADEFEVWLATLRHVCARAPRDGIPGAVRGGGGAGFATTAAASAATDLADRIASLRRFAPLAGLGIHPLGEIASDLEERTFEPGQVLWDREDAAGHLLAILSGAVRCTASAGPAPDAGPGSLLGLTEALCAGRFDYRAEARSTVRALRIGVEALVDVLEDDPEAGVELLCEIARGVLRGAAPRNADPAVTPGGGRDDAE
jgi:hypothetical protein